MAIDPACDLVDGVAAADASGVVSTGWSARTARSRRIRAGLERERRHGVRRAVPPAGRSTKVRSPPFLGKASAFHMASRAEDRRTMRASRTAEVWRRFRVSLSLKIVWVFAAHHHHWQIVVIFHLGDDVVVFQQRLRSSRNPSDTDSAESLDPAYLDGDLPRVQDSVSGGFTGTSTSTACTCLLGTGDASSASRGSARTFLDQGTSAHIDFHHRLPG